MRELLEEIEGALADGRRALGESSGDVGQTILKQMGGWGRIRAMTGAKNPLLYSSKEDSKSGEGMGGVSFKFPRAGRGMPNHVKIILNGKDLYDLSFGSAHGMKFKPTKTVKDVSVSELKPVFEKESGLRLSL